MPTYEYACDNCGTHVDVVHGFHERGPRKCADCGSTKMRKVFHPAGIVLKGSGFYKTDSRAAASSSDSSGSSKSGNGSKPESKSDTKAKADSKTKADSGSAKSSSSSPSD